MKIGYGTLVDALAEAFDVPDEKASAFASRLKYFGRLGFPVATKVGRGQRATYDVLDAVQLALAIELTDLGIPPVPMVHRISAQIETIARDLVEVIRDRQARRPRVIWRFGGGVVLARPGAKEGEGPVFAKLTSDDVAIWIGETKVENRSVARAMLLIDPTRLVDALENGFGRLEYDLSQIYRDALAELAEGPSSVSS